MKGDRAGPDFFIVGSPRSGTTLAQRLAVELTGVAVPPETHFFTVFFPEREWRFPLTPTSLRLHLEAYAEHPLTAMSHRDIGPIIDGLGGHAANPFELFGAIVRRLAGPAELVGEKTPHHLVWWQSLSGAFPESRFIWVVRDPRAVVESNLRVPWGMSSGAALAEMWRSDQSALSSAKRELGGRLLVARYEDIVADPDRVQRALAEHIGHDGVTHGAEIDPLRIMTAREDWKTDVLGPIRPDRDTMWTKQLPATTVGSIESICGDEMRKLGYEPGGGSRTRVGLTDRLRLWRVRWARWRRRRSIEAIKHRRPGRPQSAGPSTRSSHSAMPESTIAATPAAGLRPRCIIFASASGHLAGPARSLLTVLRAWSGTDLHQVLIAPAGDLVKEAESIPGVSVTSFPLVRRGHRGRRAYRAWASLVTARQIWKHRRALVAVHANGVSELSMVGPGAFLTRSRVVVWSHASVLSGLAPRMARMWMRLLPELEWAAVSSVAADALGAASIVTPADIPVVPNPISAAEVVAPRPERTGPIRVGFLSGATQEKGFDVLVEAAGLLDNLDVEWWLFTRPDGARADSELVDASSRLGNVRFIGHVVDVATAYSQVDIVFVPSRRESFGRVAAEAMLNGIPVVASDIPAMRELVGADSGLLFAPGDAAAAAEHIGRLVVDPELRHRFGSAGPMQARAFEPEQVRSSLQCLYDAGRD